MKDISLCVIVVLLPLRRVCSEESFRMKTRGMDFVVVGDSGLEDVLQEYILYSRIFVL